MFTLSFIKLMTPLKKFSQILVYQKVAIALRTVFAPMHWRALWADNLEKLVKYYINFSSFKSNDNSCV